MTLLTWIAAGLTLASVYLIGRKLAVGHLVGLAGSACWIVTAWGNDLALVVLNSVFVLLYLKNWKAWRRI
jgi:hypothetical protein